MSKKANPAWIGGFVVGAVALAIIFVMLLGGQALWDDTFDCVLYFDESVSGLDIGAPVDFQGVRIGTVTDVYLEFDMTEGAVFRPVVIQLEERRVVYTGVYDENAQTRDLLDHLVDIGLRARLAHQSMLTGKLKVELGFFPDRPVRRLHRDADLWEMPTTPSPLKHIMEEATQLPLSEIVSEAHRALQRLADNLDPEAIGELVSHMHGVMEAAQTSMDDLQQVLHRMESRMDPMLISVTQTSEQIGYMLNPYSPTRGELSALIYDLRETSRSLRLLTDYLEQHPESVFRGKK